MTKKKTRSQIGKQNRQNGKIGERKVVNILKRLWKDCARDLNDYASEKSYGIDLRRTGGIAVQVKYYEKHRALYSKYLEIQPPDDRIPVLVSWPRLRKNGVPVVVLALDDFIKIAENPEVLELEREEINGE